MLLMENLLRRPQGLTGPARKIWTLSRSSFFILFQLRHHATSTVEQEHYFYVIFTTTTLFPFRIEYFTINNRWSIPRFERPPACFATELTFHVEQSAYSGCRNPLDLGQNVMWPCRSMTYFYKHSTRDKECIEMKQNLTEETGFK